MFSGRLSLYCVHEKSFKLILLFQLTFLYGTGIRLRKHKEISQDHFMLFYDWSFRESNWRLPLHQQGNHKKSSPRGTHCKLGARRYWCKCRKYYISPALFHWYPPKLSCHTLALQSTLRPYLQPKMDGGTCLAVITSFLSLIIIFFFVFFSLSLPMYYKVWSHAYLLVLLTALLHDYYMPYYLKLTLTSQIDGWFNRMLLGIRCTCVHAASSKDAIYPTNCNYIYYMH